MKSSKSAKSVKQKKIAQTLQKALLQDSEMSKALYEYELEEHIDYWYKGLKADQEDYVLVVTENSGDVAMVVITKDQKIYFNEEAKEQLKLLWKKQYFYNIKQLIPLMSQQLANDILSVTGLKIARSIIQP